MTTLLEKAINEASKLPADKQDAIAATIFEKLASPRLDRRAVLALPLEERRRILAEQAEKMAKHYEQDKEWREAEVGDLFEY